MPGTRVTLYRKLAIEPGLGAEMRLQVLPFQCSIRVISSLLTCVAYVPTAQTSLLERATRPYRNPMPVLAGVAPGTRLHTVPFQRSTRVWGRLLVNWLPTAQR